jgi:ribosome hibernation promoting factor
MKINLSFHGIKPRPLWRNQVEKEIQQLERLAAISVAEVVLERRREAGPLFRMRAHLAVPGPDFHAEGRDHTFAAALRKLLRGLTRQIQERKSRRLQRRRDRLRYSALGTGFGSLATGRR